MKKYLTEDSRWVTFAPQYNNGFYIEKAGYFDERPEIHTSVTQLFLLLLMPFLFIYSAWAFLLLPWVLFFGWGSLWIHLPIKTGIQDCESAAWGFNYHDNTIWVYIGGAGNFEGGRKWVTWSVPFFTKKWVRTSILLKDNTWEHETKGNKKEFYSDKWKEKQKSWTYNYTDKYDNSIIPTIIYVEEREWRPKWLTWTKLFAKTRTTIDVHFSKEVGKRKGSWKGGVLGCSYELLKDEDPLVCLIRMEKEREF